MNESRDYLRGNYFSVEKSQGNNFSRNIVLLLVLAVTILIIQSLYTLANLDDLDESIVAVNQAAGQLNELAEEITAPIANVRSLSMEMVLSPNQELVDATIQSIDRETEEINSVLGSWQENFMHSNNESTAASEFQGILSSWQNYYQSMLSTRVYMQQGIRVAAFLSVTREEKSQYEALLNSLKSFGNTQISISQNIYETAQENSEEAFRSSIIYSIAEILTLILILYLVFRMFRSYMNTSRAFENQLATAAVDLQGFARQVELLQRVATVANSEPTFEDALNEGLNVICASMGWPVGHVYLLAKHDSRLLIPADIWVIDDADQHSSFKQVTMDKEFSLGEGLPGRVLESGEVCWIDDVTQDNNFPRAKLINEFSLRTGIGIPVIADEKCVAVIEVLTDNRESVDNDLIQSLTQVGKELGRVWRREKITAEISGARKEAEEGAQAKSAFLAAMSHEIRTPMNGILGMVDLLAQTQLSTDQRFMLNTVGDSGNSLLTIINDILDFSKIEAGKLDIEHIEMSLVTVVEAAAQALATNAHKNDIQILTYVDPRVGKYLKGDPTRIRQLIINMGSNAIKFSPEGQEVLIRADLIEQQDESDTKVRFSIIDQGIGISEVAQKSLFEEFSQADRSTTRKFGGTGLGLAICKRLTELMGGKIGVDSELGEGSTFWCEMPFGSSGNLIEDRKVNDLSDLSVLTVSGSENYQSICSAYLKHWNAEVEPINNKDKLLNIALQAKENRVPLDIIVFPDANDHEAFKQLREDFSAAGLSPYPRFVIGEDPQSKSESLRNTQDVVLFEINPIKRAGFLTAVAVAAGRASPEVSQVEKTEFFRKRSTPTVAEALEQGELILLAEDNLTNQQVIRRQLNTLGYQCEIANDGAEAFKMWQSKSYRMLLTDCHMPEWDGFQLTAAVRKAEENTDSRAPIVAITANALQGEAGKCLAAGMDDYLSKPVEMKVLQQALIKWMGEKDDLKNAHENDQTESISSSPSQEKGADRDSELIDERMLKDMFGEDEEVFKEMLVLFVDPSADIVSEIKRSYSTDSSAGLKEQAHKLKSSARTIGANKLADICQELEIAGSEENWSAIEKLVPKIEPLFLEIKAYIQAL